MTEPVEVLDNEPEQPSEEPSAPAEEPSEDEAAEAEEGEPAEEQPEGEQQPAPDDQKVARATAKKVVSANNAHAKRVGEAFGEMATDLELCPRCMNESLPFGGIAGFIVNENIAPLTQEIKNGVLASVGEGPVLATEDDPYTRTCDTCKGSGNTLTGSRRNEYKTRQCPDCKGAGYVQTGNVPDHVAQAVLAGEPVQAVNGERQPAPDEDLWGRKVGDPNYGKHPLYVT